ncbi:MAG: ATP-binding domain-containing protein, partial [Clostridia bacterium]|nr:ATP-binding domain-containing protein [Clostridia bacterium]
GQEVSEAVAELVTTIIPERFGYDPQRDIQVLSPMRKGETGIYQLNQMLQQSLNPEQDGKPQRHSGSSVFRLGDRVMQIKNDYTLPWTFYDERGILNEGLGVYNGDMGAIIDIDPRAELLTVRFDDQRLCEYRFDMLENLEHAFAITVHKSQGSEFPAVIIPLAGVPSTLVCRNLLYTAVTRAKKLVVIVGSPIILEQMVKNLNERERFSGLKERFCDAANYA